MGIEQQRKAQLVEATIHEIGASGTLNVSVSQIARRAGVSAALAFHYFGDKDQLFLASMRHTLAVYGAEVRAGLAAADSPRARLAALIHASFGDTNFRSSVIAAWLNFYALAQRNDAAKRLLSVYHRRLRSNLRHDLRPLAGARAEQIADRIGGLIDGLYLRHAINPDDMTNVSAAAHVTAAVDAELGQAG